MRTTNYKMLTRPGPKTIPVDSSAVICLLLALHVGLAMLFRYLSIAATIHAVMVLVLGLWTALTSDDLVKVIPYAAYIMGAEILWRMTGAGVFWEFGKYSVVLLFFVALIKHKEPLKNLRLSVFYFLLFVPSIYLTLEAFGFSSSTRDMISFNLSGPLATAMCIVFFSQVTINQDTLKKSVWAAVYPIVGVLTLAIQSTLTATAIDFGSESNFITSGGYGPNQVSAILGLGAMLLILYAIHPKKFNGRVIAIGLSLLLIAQSFLTFSRGGLYNLAIGLGLAFIVLLRKPTKIIRPFLVLFVVFIVVGFVVFPRLETLTGGALSERFSDIDPISRIGLAEGDYKLFLANPIAGVGVGMSNYLRGGIIGAASHTEYSRIMAEHGMLGILALMILLGMLLREFIKAPNPMSQAWLVALAGWAGVEMSHSAMRVVAVSFLLGFAFVTYKQEDNPSPEEEESSYVYYKFRRYEKKKRIG